MENMLRFFRMNNPSEDAFEHKIHPKQEIIDLVKTCLPIGDRVIVIPDEREKVTKGTGIALVNKKGEEELQIGTVIAVGEGYTTEYGHFIATKSKVGDRVLIDRFNGVSIRVDKKGMILPQHEGVSDERLPVRIIRQDGILWTFPTNWPV